MSMRTTLAAWLVMLLVSVANGAVRDFTYGKYLDELTAHQLSTLLSVLLLGLVMWNAMRRQPPASSQAAIGLGLVWLALTVAFEFLFFHFAGGHAWSALLGNYNVLNGRVWVFVLVWIAIAPTVYFRLNRPSI